MAQTEIEWLPDYVNKDGRFYKFDMIAPITGDAVFKYVSQAAETRHLIIPNPQAAEHQRKWLNRGS